MKIKMNINTKMLVYILSTTIIITLITVGYTNINTRILAINNAEIIATKTAKENALIIEKTLSEDLAVLKTLAQAFTVYENMDEQEWKTLFLNMYYEVYKHNSDFYKLWDSWELIAFDSTWNKNHGRYAVTVFNKNGQISNSESIRSANGDSELYASIKNISKDMLWEPYWDEFLEDSEEKKFMTTLSSPILRNDKFAGIVAADIIMSKLQELTNEISTQQGTNAYLISNEGTIVAHPDQNFIGESISSYFPEFEEQFGFSTIIKNGQQFVSKATNTAGNKILIVSAPIQVGEHLTPWSLTLTIPFKTILAAATKSLYISIIIGLLGIIFISLIVLSFTNNISVSLNKTKNQLSKIAVGNLNELEDLNIKRADEIGEMALALNKLKEGLKSTSIFAKNMGEGNLDAEFSPLGKNDTLGNSLLDMRTSLKHAQTEDEKRKVNDEKQNWATTGLAKFAEILRSNSTNIKELSFNIMSNLISYLELNQGALFVLEKNDDDDESFLVLKSAIAYDRDKFLQKKLALGESLVGRCAYEMKSIYMTKLPQDYINITSGLGTANPSSILLVPLILNDEAYGVIELASFKEIEPYQIDFVEKLGESIASTISSVKVNETTSSLLEKSKIQAEELAAQEEEMRQNMEELQATQEEASRREFELSGIVNALGSTAFTVEYDLDGTILSCNEKYAEMLGIPKESIIGQKHSEGYDESSEMGANYAKFWADLCNGISKREVNKVVFNNTQLWIEENYTPIKEPNETLPYKILKIGFDISEQKNKELKLLEQEAEIKKENILLHEYKGKIAELEKELELAKEQNISTDSNSKEIEVKISKPQSNIEQSATGTNLLDWTDAYVLGIVEMDEQHEQLVNLANTLNTAYIQNKNKKEIKENLRSFIDFASYHFGNEEHYFDSFSFNDKNEHIEDHQNLLKKVKDFQKAYTSNKIKTLDDILGFIAEWLNAHFINFDAKYTSLFKTNGM